MTVKCSMCGKPHNRKPSWVGNLNFCSRFCSGAFRRRPSVQFWRNVYLPEDVEKDCWIWLGTLDKDRYGRAGVNIGAHRMAYELMIGPIPEGLLVRHSCHNPPCVNPSHLMLGNTQDNSTDMVEACRSLRGEKSALAVLTSEDVLAIRDLKSQGISVDFIAKSFKVSHSNIYTICRRKSWRHL